MVSEDRGQLLLIGAVLIGLTIIGTVVLLNGMQYADAAGAQSESRVLDDAERTEEMVERDVGRLTTRIIANDPSSGDAGTYLERNVSTYDNQLRNMTLSGGGPTVHVAYNDTATRGTRFRQTGPDLPPGGSGSWDMATQVNHTHRFDLNVTGFDNSGIGTGLFVAFNNGSDEWQFRVFQRGGNTVVQTQYPTDSTWNTHCDRPGPPPELDLVRGDAYYRGPDTTCSFPAIAADASTPHSIRMDRSDDVDGEFDVLVDGDHTSDSRTIAGDYPVVPAVDFTYSSTDLTYNRTVWVEGGPS